MEDKKFDKLLKNTIQKDKQIPEKINQLFSNFEMEDKMEEKNKEFKLNKIYKLIPIAASLMMVTFFGGCTYAHVNGTETIISPLLRKIGINSKYEENKISFNNEVKKDNISIKLLDGAIDETSLIVGYEIQIKDNKPDNWIEIEGTYKINDVSVYPINSSIDKLSDTSYIYYQIFDVSEIRIEDKENVKINSNIYKIKEYMESESIDSVEAVYGKEYENNWNFEERIALKKIDESKVYEFKNADSYKLMENVNISVTEFLTGSYTNILKIKTDKTNYDGNSFEKYYKVLDNNNKEICMFTEEERQYDHSIYTDRLILGEIEKNSQIKIEVYLKMIDGKKFIKTATIPIDLSNMIEKIETVSNLKEYATEEYKFKYNDNWNLIEKIDTTKVGPKSLYLGALGLEIPSTTNSNYTSTIYVKVENIDTQLDEYVNKIIKQNEAEYINLKSKEQIEIDNQRAFKILSNITDGEENYICENVISKVNQKIYNIYFWGSEKEYNNLKNTIDEFLKNFEIRNK